MEGMLMHVTKGMLLGLLALAFTACSNGNADKSTEGKPEHVWRTQTEALERARGVENTLNDAFDRNLKASEQP